MRVCVTVCVSSANSAIAPNKTTKKGHHMNQRPMGKILKGASSSLFSIVILLDGR